MRFLFGCFIASFILMLCGKVFAQNNVSNVQGQILLPNSIVTDTAAIMLIRLRDSTLLGNTSVAGDGYFGFNEVPEGYYVIHINCLGCLPYISAPFNVQKEELVSLPVIILKPDKNYLKTVTITNKRGYIESRSDKIVLNIEKAGVGGGVSILDVLKTAPGVRVDQNSNLLLRAGQKAAIAINGKLVNLSTRDALEVLQNMQSNNVGQVELIFNPSAKYDAGGSGGVINIILKKGQNDGLNGSVLQALGYGNYFKINSGVNLNYRHKGLNFFGSYGFGENNTDHTIQTNRWIGAVTNFDVDYFSKQRTYASNYTAGADYNLNATHAIGFLITGAFNNNFLNKNTVSAISNSHIVDSTLTTSSLLNRHINNINYNLNYDGRIGHTNQTLSADADYFIYNRVSYEDLNSTLYNVLTMRTAPAQYYRNEAPTHIYNVSGKIDYVNPVSDQSRIEAGVRSSHAQSDNEQRFYNVVDNEKMVNTLISSQFTYKESVTSGYFNYLRNPVKRFNYQLGLRAEHTESHALMRDEHPINRSYTDFFPSVTFNYLSNANNRFSLSYNRRIDRATYQDLNPIITFQDKYNYAMGYPYLRPAYTDRVQLTHTYKNKFITALYTSFVRDFYEFTYFSQNDTTFIYNTGKMNLKRATMVGITFNGPFEVNNWWDINIDVDASYQHYTDYHNKLNQGTTDLILKLNQQFLISDDWAINLSAEYETPTFFTIYKYNATGSIMPSITKQLFNKRATVNFTAQDIFNTDRARFSSIYDNLNMVGYNKKETRIFRLSFSYRFGKTTIKSSRKHSTGNSDDVRRMLGN